ncbi:molybdate ABC transporter substrate-binding protein [Salsipaludibacter albus]|uniref:molybdate ABC transporter substrate-binding protein n=1 Tax=Salsipaludibacter albus TaxID=2849650 RepID=UPI001EE48E90|nr:molybdate ABC transporter substrate-binding protein [Salsipaludibacter albus]
MPRPLVVAVLVGALVLTACGDTTSATPTAENTRGDRTPRGEVLVSAAASLTDAFGAIEDAFEDAHPDVDVVLNLGGSSALREQLLEGAPADVFASADPDTMAEVVDAGLADGPTTFATNGLVIAVPTGNPGALTGLDDLADDDLLVGLCAPTVPCGMFARRALDMAGVVAAVDTEEPDVRALLTKIAAGELDAGITYVTDVASSSGSVEAIDLPDGVDVVATYPVATLADAPNPTGASAFVDFVVSDRGRDLLSSAGFGPP